MAKPDWQMKRRDNDRGPSRARDLREPMRDGVVLHVGSNGRSDRPRQNNFKPPLPKQGVNGALRAANLRLLLEKAPVREALALVAEVPLERLEAMSQGALCPDETAFHIEKALKLPGKWLDGLNKVVPEHTLELLKYPDRAGLLDDDVDEEAPVLEAVAAEAPVPPAASRSAVAEAASGMAPAPLHSASAPKGPEAVPEKGLPTTGRSKAVGVAETPEAAQASKAVATGPSKSSPKATQPMPSPEVRQRNLSLLLQGKGAKSALARAIGISQPYMSSIANGGKVLDQDFCRNIAQALGLPDDWFEAPRTAADIPAVALHRLAPLPRGKGAGVEAQPTSDKVPAQAAATGIGGKTMSTADVALAQSSEEATAATGAGAAEKEDVPANVPREDPASRQRRPRRQAERQDDSTQRTDASGPTTDAARPAALAPVQADLLSQVEPEVQPSTPETLPAAHADVITAPTMASEPAPAKAAVSASSPQTVQTTRAFAPVSAPPLIIEGSLGPITEALIKILALKDRQGALSEDKAFELLGAVRLL